MARFTLRSWSARLLASCLRGRRAPTPVRPRKRGRLGLEAMEDRTVPAVALTLNAVAAVPEGTPTALTGSVSGLAASNNFNLTIDWGAGGTAQVVTLTGNAAGNATFSVPHTYAQDATYPVGVSLEESPLIVGTDAVFIIDQSGSTNSRFSGTPVGDVNGDGYANEIIDAEIAAFIALNQNLIDRGLGNTAKVSVVSFATEATLHDLNPVLAGSQTFTTPLADADGNGVRDVDQILRSLRPEGLTYYREAIAAANTAILNAGTPPGGGNVIFLSDGEPNPITQRPTAADANLIRFTRGQNLRAFGVGASVPLTYLRVLDPTARVFTSTDQILDVFNGTGPTGGGNTSASTSIQVNNVAPSNAAVSLSATTIDENGSTTLSGTFADPGTQDTHTVTVDWGDGTTSTVNLAAGVTTFSYPHQYLQDGSYAISVVVADEDNAAATTAVTVGNVAPSGTAVSLSAGTIGENGSTTLSGSFTDPGSLDTHTVTITWGDGSSSTLNLPAGVTTFSTPHQYTQDGSFPIGVVVTDSDGSAAAGVATSVTVSNVAPSGLTLALAAATIDEGGAAALSGSVVDPGGQDAHTVTINWGDGSAPQTITLAPGVLAFDAAHTYADSRAAAYVVTVTVADEDNASTSATTSVSVNNVAPVAAIGGPTSGNVGQALVFTLTAADAPADAARPFTFAIDWDGDGIDDRP